MAHGGHSRCFRGPRSWVRSDRDLLALPDFQGPPQAQAGPTCEEGRCNSGGRFEKVPCVTSVDLAPTRKEQRKEKIKPSFSSNAFCF